MQIHNLPERQTISETDQAPFDTGTTTYKTPFSVIRDTIKAAAQAFSSLSAKATASDTDVLPIDSGSGAQKITFGIFKNQVLQKSTPAYTSGDEASPTAWTAVDAITSGEVFTSFLTKITTMAKNVRYLYSLLGSADITGTGQTTITGAVGGNDISGLSSDGTLSGAAAKAAEDITSLKNDLMPVSQVGYIKFPDGTAIAYGTVTFPATSVGQQTAESTFPITFTATPRVVCAWQNIAAVNNYLKNLIVFSPSTSSTKVALCAERTSANYDWSATYIAIGRWK